jgi:hypothetical protein
MRKDLFIYEELMIGFLTVICFLGHYYGQGKQVIFLEANGGIIALIMLSAIIDVGNKKTAARFFRLVTIIGVFAGAGLGFSQLSFVAALAGVCLAYISLSDFFGDEYLKSSLANLNHMKLVITVFIMFRYGDQISDFFHTHGMSGTCRIVFDSLSALSKPHMQ